jgi:hypothetical protein
MATFKTFSDAFLQWEGLSSDAGKEMPENSVKSEEEVAKFTVRDCLRRIPSGRAVCALGGGATRWADARPRALPQVPEGLSEVERAVQFLNGGLLMQQKHAIAKLVPRGLWRGLFGRHLPSRAV